MPIAMVRVWHILWLSMSAAMAQEVAVAIDDAHALPEESHVSGEVNAEASEAPKDGRLCTVVDDSCWVDAECCSGRCQFNIRKCRPVR